MGGGGRHLTHLPTQGTAAWTLGLGVGLWQCSVTRTIALAGSIVWKEKRETSNCNIIQKLIPISLQLVVLVSGCDVAMLLTYFHGQLPADPLFAEHPLGDRLSGASWLLVPQEILEPLVQLRGPPVQDEFIDLIHILVCVCKLKHICFNDVNLIIYSKLSEFNIKLIKSLGISCTLRPMSMQKNEERFYYQVWAMFFKPMK